MREHLLDQLRIAPVVGAESKFSVWRPLLAQQIPGTDAGSRFTMSYVKSTSRQLVLTTGSRGRKCLVSANRTVAIGGWGQNWLYRPMRQRAAK